MEGEKISFECEADIPYPVEWFKDDVLLKPSARLKIETLNGNVHKLTILQTTSDDKGKYSIKMKDISSSADLVVKVLPESINRLEEGDKNRYIQLLQSSETEKRYFVRIMIVGKESVGKTCLLRRLLMESTDGVTSTDGVDIVVRRCKIDINDGNWIIGKDISDDRVDRIQRAILQRKSKKNEKSDKKESSKSQDSKKYGPTEVVENSNTESNKFANDKSRYPVLQDRNHEDISNKSSTILSEIKPSTSLHRTNADVTSKINISRHENVSTSTNDTADNTKTFDNIDTIDNKFSGNVKDNENVTNTETMNNLKDKDKKNSLVMPQDLMSSVFTTSTSNITSNRYALCGLWDFAGQKEFYATHQAFLTNNAIYLVVVDMTEDISIDGTKRKIFADFQNVGGKKVN
ncbi:unnamed protein product [Mytilus coruscus]|uniref:Immunoglobulin I-set domain-containing protein n=1 Tax=Mytilus coruscus TaxID=42192 RepID=A0A6J8AMQ9_MYTCO|nr:unnamed protein product [Mytilus coruscus]